MCSLHRDAGEFCFFFILFFLETGKLPHLSSHRPCSEIIKLASLVSSHVWVNYEFDIYLICAVPLAIAMPASGRLGLPNSCVGSQVTTCPNLPCPLHSVNVRSFQASLLEKDKELQARNDFIVPLFWPLWTRDLGTVCSHTQLGVFMTQESFASVTWPILLEWKSFGYIILSSNSHVIHPVFLRYFKNSFSDRIWAYMILCMSLASVLDIVEIPSNSALSNYIIPSQFMITAMNFFLSIKRFNILNFRLYKNFHILVFKGMKHL